MSTKPHQAWGSLLVAIAAATSTVLPGGILQRPRKSPLAQKFPALQAKNPSDRGNRPCVGTPQLWGLCGESRSLPFKEEAAG